MLQPAGLLCNIVELHICIELQLVGIVLLADLLSIRTLKEAGTSVNDYDDDRQASATFHYQEDVVLDSEGRNAIKAH